MKKQEVAPMKAMQPASTAHERARGMKESKSETTI